MHKEQISAMCSSYIRLHDELVNIRRKTHFQEQPIIERGRNGNYYSDYPYSFRNRGRPTSYSDYCAYFTNRDIQLFRKKHDKIIQRIRAGTTLQKWLSAQTEYDDALIVLENKCWYVSSRNRVDLDSSVSLNDKLEWLFLRVIASALLVYFDTSRFRKALLKTNFIEISRPTEKIAQKAANLLSEIRNSEMESSKYFERRLEELADRKAPSWSIPDGETTQLSASHKRKLMIREIALLSPQTIFLKRSKQGRFPPNLVLLILKLAKVDSDLRTVQFIQKPYDNSSLEKLDPNERYNNFRPLTIGLKNEKREVIAKELQAQGQKREDAEERERRNNSISGSLLKMEVESILNYFLENMEDPYKKV